MTDSALVNAARVLAELGREDSARTLLARMAPHPKARDELERLADGSGPISALCRETLLIHAPDRKASEAEWNAFAQASRGRPMSSEMFQARLDRGGRNSVAPGNGPDVCYILGISLPQDVTGYSMRTQSLVRAWQEVGLQVHCLTRPGFPWHRGLDGNPVSEVVDGITYHRCGGAEHRIPRDLASFIAAEEELTRKLAEIRPKVVMAASNHGTAIPACLAARRHGLPFAYDVRGFWEFSRAAKEPGWKGSPAYRTALDLEGAVMREADLILTLNAPMREELLRRGVRADRIHIVPNAADPERFSPRPRNEALAKRAGLVPGLPVIGYIGTFSAYEGLDDLLHAASILAARGHEFHLLLVGDDPCPDPALRDALHRQAAEAGLGARLITPGRISAQVAPDWYSLIDICPMPRKNSDVTALVSPLKPLEAMAMEKPVIVPDLPPLVEIVTHERTGLVYPAGDIVALADSIERLLESPGLGGRLGAAARQWVMAERSWTAVAEPSANALRELAVNPTKAA